MDYGTFLTCRTYTQPIIAEIGIWSLTRKDYSNISEKSVLRDNLINNII